MITLQNPLLDTSVVQGLGWRALILANTVTDPKYAELLAKTRWQGYRPPEWNKPQLNYIVDNKGNAYFFDAILRVEHNTSLRITTHPLQNGASISDHAYQLPARVTMEIGMSDAMQSYISGFWGGTEDLPKSVNAYQTLKALQKLRVPLTVTTRLDVYSNMLIQNMTSPDDHRTLHGLRAFCTFEQILVATVNTKTISTNAQVKDTTEVVGKSLQYTEKPVSAAKQTQNLITGK